MGVADIVIKLATMVNAGPNVVGLLTEWGYFCGFRATQTRMVSLHPK